MNDRAVPGGKLKIGRLPVGMIGKRSSGWWGMLMLIAAEGSLFLYLLFSYYYFAFHYGRAWLPHELPHFKLSGPNTVILVVSSVAVWFGERGMHKGSRGQLVGVLSVGFVLGAIFVGIQLKEWMGKPFSLASHSYGSLFFTVTGFHMAHVVPGLLVLAPLILWSALGYFDRHRGSAVSIGAIYWHFIDVVCGLLHILRHPLSGPLIMATREHAELEVGHPAPDRGRVSPGLLMSGIFGAPAAWMLQLLAGSSIAGLACLGPGGTAVDAARVDWASPAMIAINLSALLIAAVALGASFRILRRTGSGYAGGHDSVMEAGEGRSRYMAIWGIWTSVLFILAIAFNTISVFWSGLCGL